MLQLVGPRDTSAKKKAAETGVDGTPVAAAVWVDAHEKTVIEDRTKPAGCDPMELNEAKQVSWPEAEKSSAADIVHKRLLEQMECLCRAVQDMGDRMEGNIAHEGLKRQEENQKLEEMCVRIDEGFKN